MKVLLTDIYTTTEEDVETGTCDLCRAYNDWDVTVFVFTFEDETYEVNGWYMGKDKQFHVINNGTSDDITNPMNFAGWLTEREFTEDELDFDLLMQGEYETPDNWKPSNYLWLENLIQLYWDDVCNGVWEYNG